MNRLNNESYHKREISIEEIRSCITKFKKKAPGASKICKQILENCTDKSLEHLKNIFNACYSAGYFPQNFKNTVIKFIPKENKSPLSPLNYRPISLLEVPGKNL